MKNTKYLILFLFLGIVAFSCDDDDQVDSNAREGGLVEVQNGLISYVVGDGATYTSTLKVYQGEVGTTAINIYKEFSGALGTTERALLKTVEVSSSTTSFVDIGFNYADLANGLSIGGTPLPTDDSELSIGDAFTLYYEAVTSAGYSAMNRATTKVAVSTRFAGVYIVVESDYIHPTAGSQGGWNGDEVIIESVDASTYHILANGPFTMDDDPDNEFYFTVDDDGNITIPKEYQGAVQTVWSGDEVANCNDDPDELPDANCGSSDYTIKDDVNGKDRVVMSHGYIRDTGTRQFYYVLEKK